MKLIESLRHYARWLHLQWPAGTVEKLPEVDEQGRANVAGVYVVGDLTGIPLLKFSLDTGTRAARHAATALGPGTRDDSRVDLCIIGAGVSGMAAAVEAGKLGLRYRLLEASEPFSTIVNFPRGKPIYTYPREMTPEGDLQVRAEVKEALVDELESQVREHGVAVERQRVLRITGKDGEFDVELEGGGTLAARKVVVAIGRSGNYRTLDVPGENLPKVYNRLHDPRDYGDRRALVVGGGDSALETAIALAECGAEVTVSYRRDAFTRAKPENVERMHALAADSAAVTLELGSRVREIREQEVELSTKSGERTLPNDVVFTMIGREAPLDFFRRSGLNIIGEWRPATRLGLAVILLLAIFVYHWKTSAGIPVYQWFKDHHLFPFNLALPSDPRSLTGTVRIAMTSPSFYYSLAYCLAVSIFGWMRIRRRRTPYVTVQTVTLTAIQVIPLFLLPYVLLPWMGHNGWFDGGLGKSLADTFFPITEWDPQGREYWRAVGFILAWPLMFWNVFTHQPLAGWLVVSAMQTFVLIPAIIYFWGKGAYCGWICSCGALAETVGDTLRTRMPHGPKWNRLNFVGQVALLLASLILVLRVISWLLPEGSALDRAFTSSYMALFLGKNADWGNLPFPFTFLNYNWIVDVTLAGILGVGLYYHFSGRVWCRFGCPLAALMHVYTRFSRFRILADKKKCISCNVCTSVCHQGIDIMSFANKGLPMEDPECVRCSACVQSCPTGVLSFGQVDGAGKVIAVDRLAASPVRMREGG